MRVLPKLLTLFFSVLYTMLVAFTAQADDIEIYLGTGSDTMTYNPNVLFIMDTSGSMSATDGTYQSRMLRVQNALKDALRSATNINAGLMRFSDYGGPILYPIRPLTDSVMPEIITSIADGESDAYQISGVQNLNSTRLKLVEGTTTIKTGLRFEQLQIPRGAQITSAFIRFTSDGFNASAAQLQFSAEATGDAAPFDYANDVESRTLGTSVVDWNTDNDWPLAGERVLSPELSSLVQEVVDRADWCGGNALNLVISGTGVEASANRYVESYEEGSGNAAELVVTYDQSTATGCVSGEMFFQVDSQRNNAEEQSNGYFNTGNELTFYSGSNDYVGVRFDHVTIPQGAVIDEAYLTFTAYQNRWGSASMNIRMVDEANPNRYRRNDRYYLRDAPKTSAVAWNISNTWYRNSAYQSPNLASVVQHMVDRGDWTSGNALMFVMSDFNGNRGAYTYSGKPSGAVQLVIKFQGTAIPETVSTVRDHLLNKVDELSANGYTPIVDTLYEASRYFGGMSVDYGLSRGRSGVSSSVRRTTRVSHRASYLGDDSILPPGCTLDDMNSSNCIEEYIPAGATYISPVTDLQCQTNNHIVLLSDGEANSNHSASKISSLLGRSCSSSYSSGEWCGRELIQNISKASESVIGPRVITHTIGFAAGTTANNFLNQLSLLGGGNFYTASDSEGLLTAFESILRSVKDVNATFVSPGVAVNQLNRLTHRDELYFALFKPAEGTDWPGNLKKYRITGNTIVDQNGLAAVDDGTGFFKETARSYWSSSTDGADVRLGGAASKFSLSRAMYFFTGPGDIVDAGLSVHESNTNITTTDLALDDTVDPSGIRQTLLKWVRGVDVKDADNDGDTTDVRLQMGDPIHSQPVIVNYSETDSAILVATNQGFLHSFDPDTGAENFAVAPKELLGNLYDFYQNNSSFSHIYGLDGDMVLRVADGRIWLYVGMRRGGRNYYAFDITNKTSPKLVFKIAGGVGDFERLGQTWSKPVLTKVKIGSTVKDVLVFAGGYDEAQDNRILRAADSVGNAVYMVDANTGALLWSASSTDANLVLEQMKYSIPARVAVVDRDGDELADHLYVADAGGQLFRLDIYNGNGLSELVRGQLLASVSSDDTETNNRRFFYAPDVSEISMADQHYYAVAIGSGYRAHPLNTVISDNIYMFKDAGVFQIDEDGFYDFPESTLGHSNLYNATEHLLTSTDSAARAIEAATLAEKDGWYIQLGTGGEKVLASPLILNYRLFFTSYIPASISESSCAPPSGSSRAYLVDLVNGNAITDLNHNDQLDSNDRFVDLQQSGIAPETKILIEDALHPVVCLGTECGSAVVELDEEGEELACTTQLDCLAQNILGKLERVKKSSWTSETERD